MWWRRVVRALWPFGGHKPDPAAQAALRASELSRAQALVDQERARRLRMETDRVAEGLAQHNSANRYADWIKKVVQERD